MTPGTRQGLGKYMPKLDKTKMEKIKLSSQGASTPTLPEPRDFRKKTLTPDSSPAVSCTATPGRAPPCLDLARLDLT